MQKNRKGLNSTSLIRSFNVVSILQTLYKEGKITRNRLTDATKISPSTVTRITKKLLDQEVIVEKGIGESKGGRKPVYLQLNYKKIYIVGIAMTRDRVDLGIADLKGKVVDKKSFKPAFLEPKLLINDLVKKFSDLIKKSKVEKKNILGVGLAISGIVDSKKGVLVHSVNLGWDEVPIVKILEDSLDLPVIVENDVNAAALAEIWFGCAKDAANFLYIKTEIGVGAGIVNEQKLITGPSGMAGEIGHIPLMPNGHKCRCGQRGCLETYLYIYDVLKRYEEKTGERLNEEEFFAKASNGHPIAKMFVQEAIEILSKAISFAGLLLDLDMVIIGSAWGNLGDDFLSKIQANCYHSFKKCGLDKTIIVKGSKLGSNTDLYGALGLVINRWFTPPI